MRRFQVRACYQKRERHVSRKLTFFSRPASFRQPLPKFFGPSGTIRPLFATFLSPLDCAIVIHSMLRSATTKVRYLKQSPVVDLLLASSSSPLRRARAPLARTITPALAQTCQRYSTSAATTATVEDEVQTFRYSEPVSIPRKSHNDDAVIGKQ